MAAHRHPSEILFRHLWPDLRGRFGFSVSISSISSGVRLGNRRTEWTRRQLAVSPSFVPVPYPDNRDGVILFSTLSGPCPLLRISADGGQSSAVFRVFASKAACGCCRFSQSR
jgi:hypothetical protein